MEEKGKRKSGKAYRRAMEIKHRDNLMDIVTRRYVPWAGYVDWGKADGVRQPVGKYIKYPKNSNAQRYLKRCSNRTIRRRKEVCQNGLYRKYFDYWWNLY